MTERVKRSIDFELTKTAVEETKFICLIQYFQVGSQLQNPELSLCIQKTPKRVALQTAKTQMKCSIMLHFIRVYTVCKGKSRSPIFSFNLQPDL